MCRRRSKARAGGEPVSQEIRVAPYLKHFGVALNRLARADKIPPTIGAQRNSANCRDSLPSRAGKFAMLVGEPGVGKTAVVEGLARLIELEPEKVPARWWKPRGPTEMGGLVAGTM